MANVAKPKDIDYDGLIDEVINKIDNEKSLFTLSDELHGHSMTLYLVGLFLFLAVIINYTSIGTEIEKITLQIAILAVLLTYVSYAFGGMENNVVDANFKKAIKKFNIGENEEEKRVLLKALLKIKVVTPHRKLGVVKRMHQGMFTKEKLLERLYEHPN